MLKTVNRSRWGYEGRDLKDQRDGKERGVSSFEFAVSSLARAWRSFLFSAEGGPKTAGEGGPRGPFLSCGEVGGLVDFGPTICAQFFTPVRAFLPNQYGEFSGAVGDCQLVFNAKAQRREDAKAEIRNWKFNTCFAMAAVAPMGAPVLTTNQIPRMSSDQP